MQARFSVGVFSSAATQVVRDVVYLIRSSHPPTDGATPLFDDQLVFSHVFTQSSTFADKSCPVVLKELFSLQPHTGPIHRVLLIDDDLHKVSSRARVCVCAAPAPHAPRFCSPCPANDGTWCTCRDGMGAKTTYCAASWTPCATSLMTRRHWMCATTRATSNSVCRLLWLTDSGCL